MSNSALISVTILSPNCNKPRKHAIDTITPHHMACNLTVEQCGKGFANPARQASSNYGIGSDGRMALYVNECDRSWCSSSPENDHRAITIEVANDKPSDAGGWHVSDKALASLINLCVDICRRNGKTKLIWCGSLAATNARKFASNEMRMTLHKWFAATGCPGPYLEGKMQYIADEVTKRLAPSTDFRIETITTTDILMGTSTADKPPIQACVTKGKQYTIDKTVTIDGQQFGKIKENAEKASRYRWVNLKTCKRV